MDSEWRRGWELMPPSPGLGNCSSQALAFLYGLLQREKWLEKPQQVLSVITAGSNSRRRWNLAYRTDCGWSYCPWDQIFLWHIGWFLHKGAVKVLVLVSLQPAWLLGVEAGGDIFIPILHATLPGTLSDLIKLSVIIVFITLRSHLALSSTDHKVNTASLNRNNRFWFN